MGGRPVCDKLWDAKDAKVVCNNKGFDSSTKAVATIKSSFGSVPANFRVSSVKCDGTETELYQCKYLLRNDCGISEGAGVVCIDPTKLKLTGGTHEREGNVYSTQT